MESDAARRTAPPESQRVTWTRRIILVAFWAVVVCLGLPHWLWTTSIHRSELPVDVMNRWAEGQVREPRRVFRPQTFADQKGMSRSLPSARPSIRRLARA